MMKKTVVLMGALLMVSAVGFAAPMNDFSAGKWQLDATVRPSLDLAITDQAGEEWDTDEVPVAKTNWDFGVTGGLNKDWAVQYKYNRSDAGAFDNGDAIKLIGHELNFLYKLDKRSSAFIGATMSKIDVSDYDDDNDYTTGYQLGMQSTVPLSEKVDGYAVVSVGNKVNSFEIGMAYKASKNLDVNISYVNRKYKDLPAYYPASYTADGVGIGLSYRF